MLLIVLRLPKLLFERPPMLRVALPMVPVVGRLGVVVVVGRLGVVVVCGRLVLLPPKLRLGVEGVVVVCGRLGVAGVCVAVRLPLPKLRFVGAPLSCGRVSLPMLRPRLPKEPLSLPMLRPRLPKEPLSWPLRPAVTRVELLPR